MRREGRRQGGMERGGGGEGGKGTRLEGRRQEYKKGRGIEGLLGVTPGVWAASESTNSFFFPVNKRHQCNFWDINITDKMFAKI